MSAGIAIIIFCKLLTGGVQRRPHAREARARLEVPVARAPDAVPAEGRPRAPAAPLGGVEEARRIGHRRQDGHHRALLGAEVGERAGAEGDGQCEPPHVMDDDEYEEQLAPRERPPRYLNNLVAARHRSGRQVGVSRCPMQLEKDP